MSIVLLIGNHPRHFHLANTVRCTGLLSGVVVEARESLIPAPPQGLDEALSRLFVRHFAERDAAEGKAFGEDAKLFDGQGFRGIDTHVTSLDDLNGPAVQSFIRDRQPGLLLSYGVHKLTPDTLAAAPRHRWNIHGGLSPWYRGAITLFWPSYMLEPQMTGITLHELTEAIDGGSVVHQTCAPLIRGDGLHELASRAVIAFVEEIPRLLARVMDEKIEPARPQRTTGRIWRARDWRPEHLRVVYELYDNRIVDRYLDGAFSSRAPKLVRQW